MDFATLFQQIVNGISLGGMYALIAIGYTMVYGVLRLINFAHADIMMVGAFLCFFAMQYFGLPFWAACIVSVIFSALLGTFVDRVAYRPLRFAPRISMLITAIGVSFFLENSFNVFFGSSAQSFSSPEFLSQTILINEISITLITLVVPALTLILLLMLLYLLYRTKQGMAIRAVAFDVSTVSLMGINANKIISLVFIIGSSLASVGGICYAVSYPTIDPFMGVMVGLKAFAAAVLGGIGSVGGAVLGGFILGFTEVMAVMFLPELSGYQDAFAFLLLILVLLFRPVGIMGDERLERSRF
ncbi:branched-chain amino acid ABC transporter permease [Helicobacter monodelphidis]|uniref:branched-chain amino acid ABC transporter permease n=1 Tax=Helicobacter sp. 15-1451 TaxID=2004995 RepID=UPI000DCD5CB0|nr:branched-chain amino acid ABC transporter permease [Helicobacter sp. 15-1451]RAX58861.1 branched-chain amino acid ABC transporter permease [Helicobacter sp. 15-1451]